MITTVTKLHMSRVSYIYCILHWQLYNFEFAILHRLERSNLESRIYRCDDNDN